jgi:hypothetical protein
METFTSWQHKSKLNPCCYDKTMSGPATLHKDIEVNRLEAASTEWKRIPGN